MIEVKNLSRTYRRRGKAVGLLAADFTIPDGQIVGILGENGAGKTTLLRAMAGLVPGCRGSALFDGKPAAACYDNISYITGEGSYFPCLTVGEYGEFLAELHPAFDAARYRKFLEWFSLQEEDSIGRLSTGQRARVELAAGFGRRCAYYLMDEPFLGKDAFTRKDFIKLISGILQGEETVLISTHYLDEVEHFLDRALILHQGRIVEDVQTDALHAAGDTLLSRAGKVCGWDEHRWLTFEDSPAPKALKEKDLEVPPENMPEAPQPQEISENRR